MYVTQTYNYKNIYIKPNVQSIHMDALWAITNSTIIKMYNTCHMVGLSESILYQYNCRDFIIYEHKITTIKCIKIYEIRNNFITALRASQL